MNNLATAFDDIKQDLDFTDSIPQGVRVHPFEAAGLGKAPYKCLGCSVHGDGSCKFCGHAIKYEFTILGEDGTRFVVGSDCVLKTRSDVLGFEAINKQHKKTIRDSQARARKAKTEQKLVEACAQFCKAHPAEIAWCEERRLRSGFCVSLLMALAKWGSWTPGQLAAVQRSMFQDQERSAIRVQETAKLLEAAPIVQIAKIEEAFGRAMSKGIKRPKLRLGGFMFKPASQTGKNPGAIYVTQRVRAMGEVYEAAYMGKVLGGKFLRVRDCKDEHEKEIVEVINDPASAAIAYGKRWGECCVCGRPLENKESIDLGIGPICKDKYGF